MTSTLKKPITNNMDRLEATVVGFFNGKSDMYDEYIVASNEMRGTFKFMHTTDKAIAEQFKIPPETVAVFQPEVTWTNYENKTHMLTKKSATYKEIIQFVKKSSIPMVGQRTKKNLFKYTEKPLVVIYYDVNYAHSYIKDTQFVRNKIVEIAKHFKDSNLRFAISNEDEFEEEIKSLGLEDSGSDVNVGCYTEKQKFRMEPTDDFESTDLAMFLEGLRTGKIKPYMKSLPKPKTQDGVIKKIVKNNENIVFGRIDGTGNDIPYMFPPLKGFPSIFFISAYEKYDPILYQGDRTYKSVKDWINRHSSIFLTEDERMGESDDDEDEMPELPDEMESFQDEDMEESISGAKEPEEEEEEGLKKDEL